MTMPHLKRNVSEGAEVPMSRLIDVGALERRVKEHIPEFNPNHHSYVETVDMLLNELDNYKSQEAYLMARLKKAKNHE